MRTVLLLYKKSIPLLVLVALLYALASLCELLIQKTMDELMQGRTSFVIAHRLSTIVNADIILVVDNGNVVEQGTHLQLLKKGGLYSKIYYSQYDKDEANPPV